MKVYVETSYNFLDMQVTVLGVLYSVDGSTMLYSDNRDTYEYDPAEIHVVQRMSDLDEVSIDALPIDLFLIEVHAQLDADPHILERLEMERASWM